ncbi:hypothetical protein CYMTET_53360, partial [Cymbomonas tetramitiformis]
VEAEELVRLEKEEESLKARFADLRKTILGRFPGPGDDLDRATRRIDMEERVAMERQANKKAAMLNAMSNVKVSLDTENTDNGREVKRKKLALKHQKQENEDWEKSCKEWSAAMELKMEEAGRNVASLEKRIADDQRKWDEVTKLQLEAQLSRVQLESDARVAELQRKDAKMHRTIGGMRDALACAEKSRGPEGGFGMATLQSLRLFAEHAKVFRLMQKQSAVAAHTPRSSSGSLTSRSGESSEANSPRDASAVSSPRDTSPPSIRSTHIPELNVEAPRPSSHPGASAIPTAATTEKPSTVPSFGAATDTTSATEATPKTAATDAKPSTQPSAAPFKAPASTPAPAHAAPVDTDSPDADDAPPTPQWQPFKSQVRRGGAGPAAAPSAAQGQGGEEAGATLDVGSSAVPGRGDGSGGAPTRVAAADERDDSAPVDMETLLKTRTGRFAGTFNSTPAEREKAAAERVAAARAAAAASSPNRSPKASEEGSARASDPKKNDRGDYDEEVETEDLDSSPSTAPPVQLGKWGMDWDFMAGKRRSEMAGAQPEAAPTASGRGQKAAASRGVSNPAPAPGRTNGPQAAARSAAPDAQLRGNSSAVGADSSSSSSSSSASRPASTATAWADPGAESSATAAPGPSASTAFPRSASTADTTTTSSRPPEPSSSSPPETTTKPKMSYEERAAAVKAKRANELAAAREEAAARERLRQRQRDAAAEELSEKRRQRTEKVR